jgi:DNA-binding transcriptional MerR regulator/quercetin dioxygenase-like cupin family protein
LSTLSSPSSRGEGWLRIAEVSELIGVSPSTLRRWEAHGFVRPERTSSRYRLYSRDDLDRLRILRRLSDDGFSVAAIRHVLDEHRPTGDGRNHDGNARRLEADADSSERTLIARRLRSLRESNGMSVRRAAEAAGVSASFVSSVERGLSGASLASLKQLTSAYGTTVAGLLRRDGTSTAPKKYDAGASDLLAPASPGVRIADLSPGSESLESHVFVLDAGASSEGAYTHAGEEFLYVLKGTLRIWVGDADPVDLSTGETLTFTSTSPHRWANVASRQTRVLWINTPPTF